ncbi:MAG: hypothetical protein ACTIAR_06145 [Brachybacterium tyrofermentans]
MSTGTRISRRRRPRQVLLALTIVGLTIPLAACDRWSSTCETDSSCHIEISGTKFYELPRPLDAGEGTENNGTTERIRLVEATEGGTATLQVGGEEPVCAAGESFTVVDTTFTCTEVGDESIVLDTVRTG